VSHVFRTNDMERYEEWLRSEVGRSALALEKSLLLKVWEPVSAQRVLEVGCGNGVFLEWLASLGHTVTGLDPSIPGLEAAGRRLGGKVGLDRGYAEDLPYSDNEFDTVALITTLEFVDDPSKALREAFRVARRNVLLGVLNKYSIGRVANFLERFWKEPLYADAKFFSVFQLRRIVLRIMSGQVPIVWRTCFSFPFSFLRYVHLLERCPVLHRHPFGHFIAMRIDVRSRLLTLQTPVFKELPNRVANAPVRTSCCRFSPTESPLPR